MLDSFSGPQSVYLASANVRKPLYVQGKFRLEFPMTVFRPESSQFQNV
jgi:hypothetical protein